MDSARYCFDTSAFIEPWRDYYPLDVFKPIWDFVADSINKGLIISPVMVKRELEKLMMIY